MAEEPAKARRVVRRRRANVPGGRQHNHRVMVTPGEGALFLQRGGGHRGTVPRLLIESGLAPAGETPTERRNAVVELFAVHRLLAGIANNVNQMARATNVTGEVQAEMAATLRAVRRVAERIDTAVDRLGTS